MNPLQKLEMKWPLILLPLFLASKASEVRNRKQGQVESAISTSSSKSQDDRITTSSSSSSSQDDSKATPQQRSESNPSGSDGDVADSLSPSELTFWRVLNRIKWHGSLISASQAIILPISSSLLTFNPGRNHFISGIMMYTIGLLIEAYSHKYFAIMPDIQIQFLLAKAFIMGLSLIVALQVELETAQSFASGVSTLLIFMSMLTLLLPYIRLHGLKDL